MTTDAEARQRIAKWYYRDLWGWDYEKIPTAFNEEHLSFLKLILLVANGDGALTAAERDWVIGRAAVVGAPEEVLAELERYGAEEDFNELIPQVVGTSLPHTAVLYMAIKAASSDGEYHTEERATVHKMAHAMGVSEADVVDLESLCEDEERLRKRRIELCIASDHLYAQ